MRECCFNSNLWERSDIMEMQRGMRGRLSQYLTAEQDIEVELTTKGVAIYDCTAFGLDAAE